MKENLLQQDKLIWKHYSEDENHPFPVSYWGSILDMMMWVMSVRCIAGIQSSFAIFTGMSAPPLPSCSKESCA